MLTPTLAQVQDGSQVFAITEAIGPGEARAVHELVVTDGPLVRHTYGIDRGGH